jgi:hypothetical protein
VYLAARWSRREEVERYAAQLGEINIHVTSRWLTDPTHRMTEEADAQAFNQELAGHDVEDVKGAEALIYFAPGGTRGGSHVEFGMALAQGKRLFWVGEREHVFSWRADIQIFPDWTHLLEYLRGSVHGYTAQPPQRDRVEEYRPRP